MESFPAMKQYFKRKNERQHNIHEHQYDSNDNSNARTRRADSNSNISDSSNTRTHSRRADSNSNISDSSIFRTNSRRADSNSNISDSSNVRTYSRRADSNSNISDSSIFRTNSRRADSNSNISDSSNVRTYSRRADSNSNMSNSTNVSVERYRSNFSEETSSRSGRSSSSARKRFCDDLNIIVGTVRHPRYAIVSARARTFESWPMKNVCVKQLVDAGFVYTLKDDIVECFQCGGVLRDWPDFANPWEQHALAFPNCPHVRRSKGGEYNTNIHIANGNEEVINSGYPVVDVVALALRSDDSVSAEREYFSNENSRHGCVKNLALDTFTVNDLTRTLARMTNKESDMTNSCDNDSDLNDVETLEEENRRLKEPVTCKICFDAIACIVTLPCGHMVSCFQCIPALTTCAVCRTPIKGTVRALMALNYSNDLFSCRG